MRFNPFASTAEMTPLQPLTGGGTVRTQWSTSIGKSGDYVFVPAVVDGAVYVAARDGTLSKLADGKTVWKISVGQTLSGGVGASERLVVVGTPKGEVLAYSADDGRPLWQARVSSEVLAAPTVGDDGVAVRAGDNRVFLLDAGDGGRKWVYQRSTPALAIRGAGSPVFAERYVFVGFPGGQAGRAGRQLRRAGGWTVALPKDARTRRGANRRTPVSTAAI
jgi:outer membrane protein assembly factor BamB